jgi:FlaA1/EpsC-like NDP-sugar epimerase
MGNPVRIVELAKALIRLSGKSEQEVGIRFTGLREGEKLFEELSYASEEILPTSYPKIRRICGTPQEWFSLKRHLDQLRMCIFTKGAAGIREKIKEIVPEYSSHASDRPERSTVQIKPEVAAISEALLPGIAIG